MNKHLNIPFILTLMAAPSCIAVANPINLPENYVHVGHAEFSWLWFDIYSADLQTSSGQYQKGIPFILTLKYATDISQQKLVQSTEEDWQRQHIKYEKAWLESLTSLWPDVSKGDTITLFIDSAQVSHFYHNKSYRGQIKGEAFAHAIAAIWLSENTREPQLRNKLIGKSE